jgi:NitT/TauT family transport system substrate-binding protein
MRRKASFGLVFSLVLSLALGFGRSASAAPLTIGYSDWPGWVAFQVAIEKGWFKEAGIDVEFQWFDYAASLDAFAAGKIDGVTVTNGDTLVTGSGGTKGVMIMLTDYSNGNDIIVAKPEYKSLKDLKGKKIGIEVGLVEHLLLLDGLKKAGMSPDDVTLVNTATNETPQVLASGDLAAIGAWQPNSGEAMKLVPGAHPVYTSAQAPGLIYDVLTVNPASLSAHKADYQKLIQVWYRVVNYIHDPKTVDDAVKIMAAKSGLPAEEYKPLLAGTKILTLAEAKKVFQKGPGLESLYGSTKVSDDFNVTNAVYKDAQDVDSYIDPSLTEALK